jgi:hypothetical protein
MRRSLTFGLTLTAFGWLLVTPGHAQRGGTSAGAFSGEVNMLRPYASRTVNQGRGYVRQAAPSRPVMPTRAEPVARPTSQGVRDYYPAMRPGQGPNRNVINPRTLCVPGRRAVIPLYR